MVPKSRYQWNVEDRDMVSVCGPFLGETNNHGGKYDADDDADDIADEGYEEASGLRVGFYNLGDMAIHLYTIQSPSFGEEYPRPQQHDEDDNQQTYVVGSGAKGCYSSRIWK